MPPLAVDPKALTAAGVSVAAVGDGLSAAVSTLTGAFNANTGQDASGVMFGRQYENTARDLLGAVAAGVNACRKTGYGIQISAVNYSRAEAQSDISGQAQPLPSPPCPAPVSPAGAPSAEGPGVMEPAMWAVVEFLVGDLWPNGSPAAMRTAAAAWRTFGGTLYGVSGEMAGPYNAIGAQQLPEADLIKQPIRDIGTAFSTLGGSCQQLANQLEGFAADVERTQNAIRELLHKLGSVGGIVGTFFEFFKGHGEDELHKIADDIKTVMNHLKNEASAKRAGIQQAEQNVDAWVRDLEKSANREFTEFFGDHVGQLLSTAFNASMDGTEGTFRWVVSNAEGIEDLNPIRFLYDPEGATQTWKGIADLSNAVTNPASLAAMAQSNPQAFEAMVKGLTRADEWSKDRPMLGASQNILDILTLPFAAGKVGETGEISSAAARVGDTLDAGGGSVGIYRTLDQAGEAGRVGGVFGNISKETPQITKSFEDIAGKPPTVEPAAGGRPAPPPHSPDASPPPVVKPVAEAPTVPRTHSTEAVAPTTPSATESPRATAPVEREPSPPAAAPSHPPPVDAAPGGARSTAPPPSAQPPSAGASTGAAQHPGIPDHPLTPVEHVQGRADNGPSGADHGGHQHDGAGHGDGTGGDTEPRGEYLDRSAGSDESHGVLDDQKRDEILAIEKGSRPDPAEYLPSDYIQHHLERFDDGATRFMTADNLDAFGIGQRDGTTFVFPRSELDSLMESTGGDRSRLEQALGLPDGYFSSYDVVRVDIPDPRNYELRMPSGNEAGANDKWIPGGFLPEGMPEAVIDGAKVPRDDIVVTDLSTKSD